jgi:hypothetical protein
VSTASGPREEMRTQIMLQRNQNRPATVTESDGVAEMETTRVVRAMRATRIEFMSILKITWTMIC